MEQELSDNFRFKFEGQNVVDLAGLTRQVFDKILPVYIKLFFYTMDKVILLKENVNNQILNLNTLQLIKLAKAAHSQIVLQIHPAVLELLLKEDPKESIATRQNFSNLYKNLKAQIAKIKNYGGNISNFLMNNKLQPEINAVNGNLNAVNNAIKAEILFRKTLSDFGFLSWIQYHNMALFIKRFWNISLENKVTVQKNGQHVELDLFAPDLKFDKKSFMSRLKIRRADTDQIIDSASIPEELCRIYPALRPLSDYISDDSPEGDNKRRTFTKYISGTEYFPGDIRILLTNQTMSPRLYDNSPFFSHTCFNRLDLFRAPQDFQGEVTVNSINLVLKTNTSRLQGRES
jgi:hypothetical protein